MDSEVILLQGARQNNLKNLDITIPKNRLVVLTGVSGSGKTSLAFETLFAEGQRRYLETLSAYARQFIRQLDRAEFDRLLGIQPSVALEQKKARPHPRSTVGTLTNVYDFLRLMYARLGKPHCPKCRIPVKRHSLEDMLRQIENIFLDQLIAITAPIVRGRKGSHKNELEQALKRGYTWANLDGSWQRIENAQELNRYRQHDIDIVIDRVRPNLKNSQRILKALTKAVDWTRGFARVITWNGNQELMFTSDNQCPKCNYLFPEIEPWFFSFSSPRGACITCRGIGFVTMNESYLYRNVNIQWEKLPHHEKWQVWNTMTDPVDIPSLAERQHPCPACQGTRLRPETHWVWINNQPITEIQRWEIKELYDWLMQIEFPKTLKPIANPILREIQRRLEFLIKVGVDYLTLDRWVHTLSTGELQRVRLAGQLASELRGILYVFDEPTVGLHARDTVRLITTMKELRDQGNTIVVVEHDEATVRAADYILDLGPGAGEKGGNLIAEGTLQDIQAHKASLTGAYLSGRKTVTMRNPLPLDAVNWIRIIEPHLHNLKGMDVAFPLGRWSVVSGVSGSGKSTLVIDVLYENMRRLLSSSGKDPLKGCKTIQGWENIRGVYHVNQSPIGRTPRSCPATYIGIFRHIRELFAKQETARIWGYEPSRFSYNIPEGRCRSCKGMGFNRVKMQFLPDVFVNCEACGGSRFHYDTLKVRWRGFSIADILNMTIDEALEKFSFYRIIAEPLQLLHDLALGYLRLGQPSHTLSGGESQRIKLARELNKAKRGGNLYLMDEPTTGLHAADIDHLVRVFDRLVHAGHTLIVIEHHLDIIANADFIIDLGPEGGTAGGKIVASGTPYELAQLGQGYTAKFLGPYRFSSSRQKEPSQ